MDVDSEHSPLDCAPSAEKEEEVHDLDIIMREYERYLQACNRSGRTVKLRLGIARRCLRTWGLAITREAIEGLLATDEQGRERARWTRVTYYWSIHDFCEFLVVAGYIGDNPAEHVEKPRSDKGLPRPLTNEEVARIRAACSGRLLDVVTIMLVTGLRVHEVAKLRGEDVQEDSVYVLGKGHHEAFIPTHPDLWEIAQRYPRRGYWFPGGHNGHVAGQSLTSEVTALFRSLGIEGSSHRLRHTFGTRLLRQGENLRTVQRLMRHKTLATTEIYTQVLDDELRAAITRLSA